MTHRDDDSTSELPYAASARSPNTQRGYVADWRHFAAWCARRALPTSPAAPQTVGRYLTELFQGVRATDGVWIERPRRLATLERRLAAIRQYYRVHGLPFDVREPALHDTLRGIRRHSPAAPRAKTPTVTEVVRALVDEL